MKCISVYYLIIYLSNTSHTIKHAGMNRIRFSEAIPSKLIEISHNNKSTMNINETDVNMLIRFGFFRQHPRNCNAKITQFSTGM